MVNIEKQIAYWRKGAEEDLPVGVRLIKEGSLRHGLFFIHLAFEKILKAHVCKKIGDLAPKDHNLVRLIEKAMLPLSEEDRSFLSGMTRFNIEGRYPDSYDELPSVASVDKIRKESERIYIWLLKQL